MCRATPREAMKQPLWEQGNIFRAFYFIYQKVRIWCQRNDSRIQYFVPPLVSVNIIVQHVAKTQPKLQQFKHGFLVLV